ncbi:hypothetical protein T10_1478, partial [Trichinella papuae]
YGLKKTKQSRSHATTAHTALYSQGTVLRKPGRQASPRCPTGRLHTYMDHGSCSQVYLLHPRLSSDP